MQLYIMRHGQAKGPEEWKGDDASRPLTPEGQRRARRVAERLEQTGKLNVEQIWTSPLARAMQTAEAVGEVLDLSPKITPELACGATLADLQAALANAKRRPANLMFVGHEPDCGQLIGELAGDPGGEYALKKGAIALLSGEFKPGGMKLAWSLSAAEILKD